MNTTMSWLVARPRPAPFSYLLWGTHSPFCREIGACGSGVCQDVEKEYIMSSLCLALVPAPRYARGRFGQPRAGTRHPWPRGNHSLELGAGGTGEEKR